MPRFDSVDLARWSGGEWHPRGPAEITSIVHDTKHVDAKALFVALRGARVDGHDFVAEAVSRGAAGAMVSRARAGGLRVEIPLLIVDDPAMALRDLAAGYRSASGLTIVGVTGSTGKTTVKEMIAALLATTIPTARTRGNWNNEIGLPLSLLAMPETTRVGVLELGISHPGEMAPLCRIAQPDWGVITNVGPVHLEFFESIDAIALEKGELFRSLPPDGTAVVSLDEVYAAVLSRMAGCRVVTTSMRSDADYTLVRDEPRTGECEVVEKQSSERCTFRLPLAGSHSRHNALLAIAVARGLGVAWAAIASALEGFVPPPMRWERRNLGGVIVINDAYNANPVSMRAAVKTFADMDIPGQKWLVLGDMLELGGGAIDEHDKLGRFLAEGEWAGLVTIGPLAAHFAAGAIAVGMPAVRAIRCQTTAEAAETLLARLQPGDGVLVKASRGKRLEEVVERLEKVLGE